MKSTVTRRFWKCFEDLPTAVQKLARKNHRLWLDDSAHPSLHFKPLRGRGERFSVRVGDHFRAISHRTGDGIEWVWIGSHEEYNKLVK